MKRYVLTKLQLYERDNAVMKYAIDGYKVFIHNNESYDTFIQSGQNFEKHTKFEGYAEVPDWATHFACGDETIMKTYESFDAENWQEIPK